VVSRHGPTCRRAAQSLGAAGLRVRSTSLPSELPLPDLTDVVAVLVDLDVSATSASALVDEARAGYPGVPLLCTAGIDARARLLDAFCVARVDHVLPKRGSLLLPRGGTPVLGSLEGPDEHDLFAAVRRLMETRAAIDGPEAPGVVPYLLSGAPVHNLQIRSTADKDTALEQIVHFAESMDLGGEKLRRLELAAEELMMNALYDAPRSAMGTPRHAHLDRRLPVLLAPNESITLRFGCDGQTVAVAVNDPFGALDRLAVADRLGRVKDGLPRPQPGLGGVGLGLVMTYTVANQLVFCVSPGRSTEVTAVLHVGGSNRAAQERGTAVHYYERP